jgi:hypothetical protein
MKFTLRNLAIVTAVSIGLSACSEESTDSTTVIDDASPSLTLGATSVSTNEGEAISISYNADDDNAISSVAIESDDILGNVSISSNEIRYTAPWLSEDASLTENFTVVATDSSGQETSSTVTVTVVDINSPVTVVMSPPSQASGFQDTQTDTSLDFWIDEGQEKVTLSYQLTEEDADELVLDYSLGNEDFIFKNNIEAVLSTVGNVTTVQLSFALPEISDTANTVSSTSEDIELTLTVSDGDDTIEAVANMTVVNVVSLQWAAGNPGSISELEGGVLTFTSSESLSYDGDYNVTFMSGDDVLDIPYDLDETARTITIGETDNFYEDTEVEVSLTLTNTISNPSGQDLDVVAEATKTVTFVDDNDEGFFLSEEAYEENIGLYADVIARRDEDRVAGSVSSFLFLNGWFSDDEAQSFQAEVSEALNAEVDVLTALIENIENDLSNGARGDSVIEKMSEFEELTYGFGYSARELITTKIDELGAGDTARSLELGLLSSAKTGQLYSIGDDSEISHYIGKSLYGSYQEDEWVFNTKYKYLGVVDIDDIYSSNCF